MYHCIHVSLFDITHAEFKRNLALVGAGDGTLRCEPIKFQQTVLHQALAVHERLVMQSSVTTYLNKTCMRTLSNTNK